MPAPQPASRRLARRIATLAAPFACGALATLIAFLLLRDSFPDKVATHFTLDGTADRYSSPSTSVGQYMLVFAIETAGAAAAGISPRLPVIATRPLWAFSVGLATATTYILVALMWSISRSDEHTIQLPFLQLPLAVASGAALGAVAWFISRKRA